MGTKVKLAEVAEMIETVPEGYLAFVDGETGAGCVEGFASGERCVPTV